MAFTAVITFSVGTSTAFGDGCRYVKRLRCSTVTLCSGQVLLEVKDLEAKVAETGNTILRGVNLTVREGEVRAFVLPVTRSAYAWSAEQHLLINMHMQQIYLSWIL